MIGVVGPAPAAALECRPTANWPRVRDESRSATLTVRGRVIDDQGNALPNTTVTLTSPAKAMIRSTRTDSNGVFSLITVGDSGAYRLEFVHIGFAAQARSALLGSRDTTVSLLVRLLPNVQRLTPVRTVAPRPRPMRDDRGRAQTPGSNEALLDLSSGLSGDLSGDPNAALAMIPGVAIVPGTDGPMPSAFGLGTDQNGATLNGADLGSSSLPRDGLVGVVQLATYDPRVGRFAGLQTSWTLPSGSYMVNRALHATFDDRNLQLTPPVANQLGSRYDDVIVSGTSGGRIPGTGLYYSSAVQASRSVNDATPLNSANSDALTAIGVSRDSVNRLLAVAQSAGLGVSTVNPPSARTTTNVSAVARLDLIPAFQFRPASNTGNLLYLLAAANASSTGGLGVAPTATVTQAATTGRTSGQIMADFETYVRDMLSTTKSSVSVEQTSAAPVVRIPEASIIVNSTLPAGPGAAVLDLGGSQRPNQRTETAKWETSSDLSWNTADRQHNFDVFADAELARFAVPRDASQSGVFSYNSIADFEADQPSSYTRLIDGATPTVSAWNGVLALSDIFTPRDPRGPPTSDGISIQYGVRGELYRFLDGVSQNSAVDSAFGRRTDHVPNTIALAPMAGFTWNRGSYVERSGGATFAEVRSVLSGGVREYRSELSPRSVSTVLRQTGRSDGDQELFCAGAAAPLADWPAYAQSATALPDACADGSVPTPLAQDAGAVSFYSPSYRNPASWREELRWRWLINGQLAGNVGVVNTRNAAQVDAFDLNFLPTPQFTLAAEGGRPVFVPIAGVDPATGAVADAGSRAIPQFGHVTELRSDLHSTQQLATVGLTYRIGRSAFLSPAAAAPSRYSATLSANYTYARTNATTRGFTSTTAGDPRQLTTAPSIEPRHAVQLVFNAQRDRLFSVTASARLSSGFRFTPLVASDINGDGYADDRAFVFSPQSTGSAATTGLADLYASAPGYARDCLRRQIGRIAGQSSCTGPWSATLGTIALTIDPYRLGLGNRGSVSFYINSLLGGIDQLLHGQQHLQGWGQIAVPDPRLLYVRGFDTESDEFLYSVNPAFGSVSASQDIGRPPFRLTMDVRLDVGPNRETQAIESDFAPPPLGIGVPTDSASSSTI